MQELQSFFSRAHWSQEAYQRFEERKDVQALSYQSETEYQQAVYGGKE
jgi:hypothetical protein